jgi:hypothetical protein
VTIGEELKSFDLTKALIGIAAGQAYEIGTLLVMLDFRECSKWPIHKLLAPAS